MADIRVKDLTESAVPGADYYLLTDSATDGPKKIKPTNIVTPADIGAAAISDLADVATSGSYNDLTGKPTIPAAGLPTGGTTGQMLRKSSGTNYDAAWSDAGAGDMVKTSYDPNNVESDAFNSAFTRFLQSGTGAALRDVQDKLRERISVRDFGAVGDGSTDDTAACQAAIDYACTKALGAVVYFPEGQYLLSSNLSVTASGVWLVGSGGVASWLVNGSTTAHCVSFYNSGITITRGGVRDLCFGQKSGVTPTGGAALNFKNCNEFRVEDVTIFNYPAAPYDGIYCDNAGQYYIHNVNIQDVLNNGWTGVNGGGGYYVTNSHWDACGKHGMYMDGTGGGYVANCSAYGNHGSAYVLGTPDVEPAAIQYFFVNCIGDTSGQHNWSITYCTQTFICNCWGSTQITGAGAYAGFYISSSKAKSISFLGGGAFYNYGPGVFIDNAGGVPENITFTGFLCGSGGNQGNGRTGFGGAPGYYFTAAASTVRIVGGQVLGNSAGPVGGIYSSTRFSHVLGYLNENAALANPTTDADGNFQIAHGLVHAPYYANINKVEGSPTTHRPVVSSVDDTYIYAHLGNTTNGAAVASTSFYAYWDARCV